jgi:enoyl-CoA hydratase/carnithine racemase
MTIELNRPQKKNAITADMYGALAAALIEAREAPEIRAVMIVGKRDVFTAGNDLQDFMDHPPSSDDSPVFRFLREISHAPKPLVAAVCGAAVGVGTTMLLHCDLVYAGDNARFSLPFAQLGLVPEAASSLLLPELFGYQRAAERLLLGEGSRRGPPDGPCQRRTASRCSGRACAAASGQASGPTGRGGACNQAPHEARPD